MKTSQKIILGITGILALVGGILSTLTPSKMVGATPALAPYQGGTGTSSVNAGDVGKFLKVSDDSPLTYVFDSASGGSQTPWTSNINGATYSLSGVGSLDATSSVITQATSTNFAVTSLTSAILLTNGNGTLAEYGGSACGAGTKADSISALGVVTCTQVDISTHTNLAGDSEVVLTGDALSLASSIARDTELPVGANPTGTIGLSAVNGSASTFMRSDGAPALSQAIIPTWSQLHTFDAGFIATASSTAKFLTMDRATSTNATSTDFFSTRGLISTFLFGNATGTNLFASQAIFTRASSTQATTTNFFTNSLMSVISNLGKATSSSMAVTGEATSSRLTVSNGIKLPAFAGQGVSIGVDSSGNIYGAATTSAFAVAFSTSTLGTGTTTIPLAGYYNGATFTRMGCTGRGGGTFTSVIGDGTASSSYVVSATGLTTTYTTLSSNNSFTSGEMIFWAFGSVSGTVRDPSCSFTRN